MAHWLRARAAKSVHTKRAYKREAARWLAFLAASRGVDPPPDDLLRSATYDDAAKYISWIRDDKPLPELPKWAAEYYGVSAARPKRTPQVLSTAVVILHGLYEELFMAVVGTPKRPAVEFNPFKPYRREFKRAPVSEDAQVDAPGVAKAFPDAAWALLWEVACAPPPPGTPRHQARLAARRRLELAMLRATWERRSAVAGMTWADLQRSREGLWMIRRVRKGKGAGFQPVPEALIDEIQRFRAACDLPLQPTDAESSRSIFWVGGRVGMNGPISDDTLYGDIKHLFEKAAERAKELGLEDVEKLFRDTGRGPHSIRHTMATQFMAAGGQARRAQSILGHSSLAVTTRVYDTRTAREQLEALQDQWSRSGD